MATKEKKRIGRPPLDPNKKGPTSKMLLAVRVWPATAKAFAAYCRGRGLAQTDVIEEFLTRGMADDS